MIIIVLIILICILAFLIIISKNKKLNLKDNILKIIVIFNIVFVTALTIVSHVTDFVIWAVVVLILINLLVLIFNKKLSKNKIILSISIVVYFAIMILLPTYKNEVHNHLINNIKASPEIIKYYTNYYDCYQIRIYTIPK